MSQRWLTALPVYNEVSHVSGVLEEVRRYASSDILVVDDGSTDGTADVLRAQTALHLVTHEVNRGYGAALRSAFDYAIQHGYDTLVTIDCDGQHQPRLIPEFFAACDDWDIVSGSRYLDPLGDHQPPAERRRINEFLTARLNETLGLELTDAFCGFKAYNVAILPKFNLTETGYAMPLELWVQAASLKLRIRELAVPLLYLDLARSFGGALDNADTRLAHYNAVLQRAMAAVERAREPRADRHLCGECTG